MPISQLRSYRIFGIAIFDLVVSIIGTALLFWIAKLVFYKDLDAWKFILAGALFAIPLGMVSHVLTGTNTTLNHALGLSYAPK